MFPKDEAELLKVWGDYFWAAFFYILAVNGLRPQEALALKWEDWIKDHNILVINKAVKENAKIGTTKTGKPKIAILIDDVTGVLSRWEEKAIFIHPGDFIFSSDKNKPVTRRTYLRHFYRGLDNANIDGDGRKLVHYSFRHTTNTNYRMDFDDYLLQAIMGHGSQKMTEWYDQPKVMHLIEQASMVKEKMEKQWEVKE